MHVAECFLVHFELRGLLVQPTTTFQRCTGTYRVAADEALHVIECFLIQFVDLKRSISTANNSVLMLQRYLLRGSRQGSAYGSRRQ